MPLTTAIAGQYWQVGDFRMQVRAVRGGNGVFTGWGVMSVPYLNVQIPVKFEGVWVDEDYNVVRGEVIALSEGLEGFQQRWQEDNPEESDEEEEESNQETPVADAGMAPTDSSTVTTVTVESELERVYVNEQGEVVAVDEEGNEEVVAEQVPEEGETLAVQDSEGNTFTVDSEGSVSSGGGGSSPSGDSDAQAASIKQALIQEGVAYFREEITFWLDNHEKGPLEEAVVLRCIKRAKECQAFR